MQCSIRFQTTFIPVEDSGDGRSKLEFATEAYNYNTMDDADPRNLVLLCTSQGMAVQQDGRIKVLNPLLALLNRDLIQRVYIPPKSP